MNTPSKNLPRLALITPYDVLTDRVLRQVKDVFHCDVYYGYLDTAADIAETLDSSFYDVILSRGGTAEYIKRRTAIPVVSILTSATDLLRALLPYRTSARKVAFFNYQEKLTGVDDIALALNISIDEYVFHNYQEISEAILICKEKKYDLTIGGAPVLSMTSEYGMKGALIENGLESINYALREAMAIVETTQRKNSILARFERVLSSIAEGIIVTDENNRILTFNKMAQKIFGINEEDVLGQSVETIIKNTRIHEVLLSKSPEIAQLQDIGSTTIVTSRIPIMFGEDCIGVVCSFTDMPHIKKAERAILKKIKKRGFTANYTFDDIMTVSPNVKDTIHLAKIYAKTNSPVLIHGESGVGKEMFAQSIHNESNRAEGPFVAINCAAIPEALLESELFGYEEGAFTGAKKQGKEGLIELAHNGTLFLDEIGELSPALQVRLLRVLQEYEILRVGGKDIIPVNIHVIGASNKNLKKITDQGTFRADLFYRLNVFPLTIPPLRERNGDIEHLALNFLKDQKQIPKLELFIQEFFSYKWPGNVRELKAVIDRLSLISNSFPNLSWLEILNLTDHQSINEKDVFSDLSINLKKANLREIIADVERRVIQHYMQVFSNDQAKVVKKLGISKMTIWRKLNLKEVQTAII